MSRSVVRVSPGVSTAKAADEQFLAGFWNHAGVAEGGREGVRERERAGVGWCA